MNYPKRFFEINLQFAHKVAEILDQPIEETLLHYTNFYIRFGLGRDFASTHPVWQEFLVGLSQVEDTAEWTHRFYLKQQCQVADKFQESPFGCFSYTIMQGNKIRLHFHNNESSGYSPLGKNRMSQRLAELTRMFRSIQQEVRRGRGTNIIGASWLYNLESYRRLFPPAYLVTAQVGSNDFPYLPLWGQFIDQWGRVKENLVAQFLERLHNQQGIEGIERCFPYQVLHLESSVEEFYPFYGL